MMKSFVDWLADQEESSAFTRLRQDAALGLKPPIPAAAIHSRGTASPFETEQLSKEDKKSKKKKKGKCSCHGKCEKCKKHKEEKLEESRKGRVEKNTKIDDFLNAVGALKDDVRSLDSAKKSRRNNSETSSKPKDPCKKRSRK